MKTTVKENTIMEYLKNSRRIKQKYPDAIILLRMSDDYLSFEQNAEIIHQMTGNKLSSQFGIAATCHFPFQQLDAILHKLVKAGWRVAVCEQLEKPEK
jgi:DNA mismatch repair protein MutS